MKTFIAASFAILLVGCQTARPVREPIVYSGGDGSSCRQAIVIGHANYREGGLMAMSQWLEQRYPGSHPKRQSAMNSAGRHYDVVEFTTTQGEERTVYFDTTECFGN